MEEEIEDLVGDVKYTDSQKSVATSKVYSTDFTDSSSDKQNPSSKSTYVLDYDTDDSDRIFRQNSVINLKGTPTSTSIQHSAMVQYENRRENQVSSTSFFDTKNIISRSIFTQTSKTIIELAENELGVKNLVNSQSLETQTSYISITENKTLEYRIAMSGSLPNFTRTESIKEYENPVYYHLVNNSLEDGSSKFPTSETENDNKTDYTKSNSSSERAIPIIHDESKDNSSSYGLSENQTSYDDLRDLNFFSKSDSDMEEDSLMQCSPTKELANGGYNSDNSEVTKSIENDVDELYSKLSNNLEFRRELSPARFDLRRFRTLTPLTEESIKKESNTDMSSKMVSIAESDKQVLLTDSSGMKIKALPDISEQSTEAVKLPPIENRSCPCSPHFNYLFTPSNKSLPKSSTLPCLYESEKDRCVDRWEINGLAAGESKLIKGTDIANASKSLHLPPIQTISKMFNYKTEVIAVGEPISINKQIKELKVNSRSATSPSRYKSRRSPSPGSISSPDESHLHEVAERGCDALCSELLRRLRASSWHDVVETLEEIPTVMEKFWSVINEPRLTDLIRQIATLVESPRAQVARPACTTLATVLKSTNYTKKPDFYEAITILLTKTGSFSRPVRRAANVALDDVVCAVDVTHSVTALCTHGVSHKSPLVRSASARLLVVCAALAARGRDLLRARPPSAAAARRLALRSLSVLLDDKNTDARKYAERLYSMLRPLSHFEAYYLTDVNVELATKQMKKYDPVLLGPSKESR